MHAQRLLAALALLAFASPGPILEAGLAQNLPPPPLQLPIEPIGPIPVPGCPRPVTVTFQLDPVRDQFARISLTGATGAPSLNGVSLPPLDASIATHVLLKVESQDEQTLLFSCTPGATVELTTVDAPIVEPDTLPARILGATFTRTGLRPLAFDNFVRVYFVAQGPAQLALDTAGATLPRTIRAFGEDPEAAGAAAVRARDRLLNDPPTQQELVDVLVRLALACNGAVNVGGANVVPCAGQETATLLDRYGLPADAARDLAGRLASDPRCTTASLRTLPPAVPPGCVGLVGEWFDETMGREGLPPFGGLAANSLRALGVRTDGATNTVAGGATEGSCGDRVVTAAVVPLEPVDTSRRVAGNRTLPSRALDCAELVLAPLRPVRYMVDARGLIGQMGSVAFGAQLVVVPHDSLAESAVTIATQGLAAVDLTIRPAPFPDSVGGALEPAESALDDAGVLPVDVLPTVAGALPPEVNRRVADLHRIRADGHAVEDTTSVATAALGEVVSPAVEALLDALDPCLDVGVADPDGAVTCSPPASAVSGSSLGLVDAAVAGSRLVWRTDAAKDPPLQPAAALDASHASAAVAAFLAPPGTPIASATEDGPAPLLPACPQLPGAAVAPCTQAKTLLRQESATATVFVPDSLYVRFDGERALNATSQLPPNSNVERVRSISEDLRGFARERLDDLNAVLADHGGPTVDAGDPPVELTLVGTTFYGRLRDGRLHVERSAYPTLRVLNLREGVERLDLDLDGLRDAQEAATVRANAAGPGLGLDPFNPDTDGDGMPDGWELLYCADAASPTNRCLSGTDPVRSDGDLDADADLASNGLEFSLTQDAYVGTACFAEHRWACIYDAVVPTTGVATSWCGAPPGLLPWSVGTRSLDSDCDEPDRVLNGIHDGWEARFGFSPLVAADPGYDADPDGDGYSNLEEFRFYEAALFGFLATRPNTGFAASVAAVAPEYATDPRRIDSDGDGLPDSYESARGHWPAGDPAHRADDVPRRLRPVTADSAGDPDGDRVTTLAEFVWSLRRLGNETPDATPTELLRQLTTWGLDPFRLNTDGDALDDRSERDGYDQNRLNPAPATRCLDPLDPSFDCDEDGLPDTLELFVAMDPGMPPDKALEGAQLFAAQCKLPLASYANRAAMKFYDDDSDGDGVADWYECWFGLDPTNPQDAAADPDVDGATSIQEFDETLAIHPGHEEDPVYFRPSAAGPTIALLPTQAFWAALAVDHDQDALPDTYERALGLDALVADGAIDTDRDGLTNLQEFQLRDGNGTSPAVLLARDIARGIKDEDLAELIHHYRLDPTLADSDDDGMLDGWEHAFRLQPHFGHDRDEDPDGDNATNVEEFLFTAARFAAEIARDTIRHVTGSVPKLGLDPLVPDTDRDGMHDGYELYHRERQACRGSHTYESAVGGWLHCFDPLDARDAGDDFDGEGLTNLDEYRGWDVTVTILEVADPALPPERPTAMRHVDADPLAADTSGAGLSDLEKAPRALTGCTGPLAALDPHALDTDGDGASDLVEVWGWTQVMGLPLDIDGDCFMNADDYDSDADSFVVGREILVPLGDGEELRLLASSPTRKDSDADTIPDGREFFQWRAAGKRPVTDDFDLDGLTSVWDPDSDGDQIDDGYEFQFGLEAWQFRGPDHDTEGDTLPDLCEYRLTRAGPLGDACPPRHDPPADDSASPGDVVADAAEPADGPPVCMDATDQDCDADGVSDDFEYYHPFYAGCSESTWTFHLNDGQLDECARKYTELIGRESGTTLRAAFLDDVNKPRVTGLVLGYRFSPDAAKESCYYHRACRQTLVPGPDAQFHAEVSIEDVNCNLAAARFFVGHSLILETGFLLDVGDVALLPPTDPGAGLQTYRPSSADVAACNAARQGGHAPLYNFRVRLPPSLIQSDLPLLNFAGRLRITVTAWDQAGLLGASFARDMEWAGSGFNFLDSLNTRIAQGLSGESKELGRQILAQAADYYAAILAEGRSGDLNLGTAHAQHLVMTGTRDYLEKVAWFGSEEYRGVMRAAGRDPDRPTAAALADPGLREKVEEALGARVRFAVGFGAMRDITYPVGEGVIRGLTFLLRSGMGHRELANVMYETFAIRFHGGPVDDYTGKFDFWDWLMPTLLDQGDGTCARAHTVTNALRGAIPGLSDPPAWSPEPTAGRNFAHIAAGIRGYSMPTATTNCFAQAAEGAGASDPGDLAWALYAGASLLEVSIGYLEAPQAAAQFYVGLDVVTRVRGAAGLGNLILPIAWQAIGAIAHDTGQEESLKGVLDVACFLFAGAGLALTLIGTGLTAGAALPLLLWFLSLLECIGRVTPIPPPQTVGLDIPTPWGSRNGLGHLWSYQLDTFPDTRTSPSDVVAPTVRVHVKLHQLKSATCQNVVHTPVAFTWAVGVERVTDNGWAFESGMVYSAENLGGTPWSKDFQSDGTWTVAEGSPATADVARDLTFYYKGAPEPGLRRIAILAIPKFQTTAAMTPPFQPAWMPHTHTGPLVQEGTSEVLRPTIQIPRGLVPMVQRWEGAHARFPTDCRELAPQSEAILLRGVGADIPKYVPPIAPATIRDVSPPSASLERTFDAVGSPTGPGYRYFWDLGGRTPKADVRGAPGQTVTWEFQPGWQDVQLIVVDGANHVVAKGELVFEAKKKPPTWDFHASRWENTITFAGGVSDPDDVISYTIRTSNGWIAGSGSGAKSYGFGQALDNAHGARGTQAQLLLSGSETVGLVATLPLGWQREAETALNGGAARGVFVGGYSEVDIYTLSVAASATNVVLTVRGQPWMHIVAVHSDGRTRDLRMQQYDDQLGLADGSGASIAGAWTVYVQSSGATGPYTISRTVVTAPCQRAGTTDPGPSNARACEETPPPPPPPTTRVLYEEGFEGMPNANVVGGSLRGPGYWHFDPYTVHSGQWSAHVMALDPSPGGQGEDDWLVVKVDLQGAGLTKDSNLVLEYDELAEFGSTGARRHVLPMCLGTTSMDSPTFYVNAERDVETSVRSWTHVSTPFNCQHEFAAVRDLKLWVWIGFDSGPNPDGARGWYLDNIRLRTA